MVMVMLEEQRRSPTMVRLNAEARMLIDAAVDRLREEHPEFRVSRAGMVNDVIRRHLSARPQSRAPRLKPRPR
jgi:hypothetical protein